MRNIVSTCSSALCKRPMSTSCEYDPYLNGCGAEAGSRDTVGRVLMNECAARAQRPRLRCVWACEARSACGGMRLARPARCQWPPVTPARDGFLHQDASLARSCPARTFNEPRQPDKGLSMRAYLDADKIMGPTTLNTNINTPSCCGQSLFI